jgi:hypothetical protein
LAELADARRNGLTAFLASPQLSRPASLRLAFRELGLAIGLRALPMIANAIREDRSSFGRSSALRRSIELLPPYDSLSERIIDFWASCAQHQDAGWQAHRNTTMSCLQRR